MRKLLVLLTVTAATFSSSAQGLDIFNHLGAGVGVGSTGINLELATPITHWVQMRAGVSYMPAITFHADADFNYNLQGQRRDGTVDLKGDLGRWQGEVIFNFYPIPHKSLFLAAGAYFGGNKLLKITGHSPELADPNVKAIIGDYEIPANSNGDISGGFKVKGFRPYLGIGWGRAIPNKLINFNIEAGVQFEGTPELYTDYGTIDRSIQEDDNTFNKVRDALKVYPTLTFRLNFRAF